MDTVGALGKRYGAHLLLVLLTVYSDSARTVTNKPEAKFLDVPLTTTGSAAQAPSTPILSQQPTRHPAPIAGTCSGTQYYVAAAGNDSNNGTSTSTPWRSVGKVNAGNFKAGDCIKFKGGDTFTDANLVLSGSNITGGTPSDPVTVQSYGTGMATIKSAKGGDVSATITVDGVNGFTVQNLIVRPGAGLFGACPGGVGANCTTAGILVTGASTGTVNANDVGGFYVNSGTVIGGGDITSSVRTDSSGNVVISNNLLHGLTVDAQDDDGVQVNGSSGNITVIGNTLYNFGGRASNSNFGGEGMNILNQAGGSILVTRNIVHDIAYNFSTQCGAGSGIETANVNNGVISYNEVYRVQVNTTSGCDGDGIDLDGGTTGFTVEYNYTHDNWGIGIFGWMGGNNNPNWGPNTFRYNISVNDHIGIGFSSSGAPSPVVYAYNNTIYHSSAAPNASGGYAFMLAGGPGGSYGGGPSVAPGSIFENNLLVEASGQPLSGCNGGDMSVMHFSNNNWYSPGGSFMIAGNYCRDKSSTVVGFFTTLSAWQAYANGADANARSVNPMFAGAIPSGACSWNPASPSESLASCLAGLKLGTSSPLLGAGASIANQGGSDIFNNPIPNGVGSGINIGADGGNP
jgi:hypothetical protein